MQSVITAKQAKQITGGRTPLVPVEYEAAIKALVACVSLDEAKYWSDKADALAAWAKIYRSDETIVKAKQLKLHAFRRMGELAAEIKPRGQAAPRRQGAMGGTLPGPKAALVDVGLTKSAATAARALALMPKEIFNAHVTAARPLSPISAGTRNPNNGWTLVRGALLTSRSMFRKFGVDQIVIDMKSMKESNISSARELAIELSEMLDELAQKLPKGNARK